jgi:hypothetical protein
VEACENLSVSEFIVCTHGFGGGGLKLSQICLNAKVRESMSTLTVT